MFHVIDITTPPSARIGEPVMALASREQRNSTASATSCGRARRLMIELGRALSIKARCTFGSSADGHALAMLRLDRAEEALAAGHALVAGAVTLRLVKPDWARFAFPGEPKPA